jgi:hypothetical protein
MAARISFERSVTPDNPIGSEEARSAEQVLARLVAAAYAKDHPELFGPTRTGEAIMDSHLKPLGLTSNELGTDGITMAGGTHARNE